ncbi:hypothetical protein MSG28_001949 [Choristoneura fumiferana]|uniref:Uncharacterized protein n=1 Tax=Choristoneura fumiferana TaxID=7141 RepID=A0ACC0JTP3_CHOFU|nr:hypothetical protein MSG28_001949 [Choristoneura fumiferana]
MKLVFNSVSESVQCTVAAAGINMDPDPVMVGLVMNFEEIALWAELTPFPVLARVLALVHVLVLVHDRVVFGLLSLATLKNKLKGINNLKEESTEDTTSSNQQTVTLCMSSDYGWLDTSLQVTTGKLYSGYK